MSISQLPAKKLTLVQSLSPPTKKPTSAQFFLLQALLSHQRGALIRDLFKKKIDSGKDNNNNDDKVINDNFYQKSLVKMLIYSLSYLNFKQYQLIVGFQVVFYTPIRPKCQILMHPSPFIITSTSISQNSPRANYAIIMLTKEKKS